MVVEQGNTLTHMNYCYQREGNILLLSLQCELEKSENVVLLFQTLLVSRGLGICFQICAFLSVSQ